MRNTEKNEDFFKKTHEIVDLLKQGTESIKEERIKLAEIFISYLMYNNDNTLEKNEAMFWTFYSLDYVLEKVDKLYNE